MYQYIVRQLVKKSFGQVNDRQFDELLKGAVPNIRHSFAGDHALGGVRNDKTALRAWFDRLNRVMPSLHLHVEHVVVKGLPHNTLVIARWTATATLANGKPYLNRGVHFIKLRWGKLIELDVYEDTLAVYNALEAQYASGITEAKAPQIVS